MSLVHHIPRRLPHLLLTLATAVISACSGSAQLLQQSAESESESTAQELTNDLDPSATAKRLNDPRLTAPGRVIRDGKTYKVPIGPKEGRTVASKFNAMTAGAQPMLAPHLTYFGGPVLQSPEVVAVFWGRGVAGMHETEEFYERLASPRSRLYGTLGEYDTKEPSQRLGRAEFVDAIVDADAPQMSLISDTEVRAELARLLDLGRLPANSNGDRIYMLHFPPGMAIEQGGSLSCQAFCAYHNSFRHNGALVYYAVMPDHGSGGCERGCGNQSALQNMFVSASHELVEAATDADVGEASVVGPPLAWYDSMSGENADICAAFPPAHEGGFSMTNAWSNQDGACRASVPRSAARLTFSGEPLGQFVPAGSTVTYTVTAAGTIMRPMTLRAMFVPPSAHVSFNPPAIAAGQTATVTVTTDATMPSGGWLLTLYGQDANLEYHQVSPLLLVQGAPPTMASLSTATGPSNGGTVVTVKGTNLNLAATSVLFGSEFAWPLSSTPDGTELTVLSPSASVGPVDVTVMDAVGQTATLAQAFTFTRGPAPTISRLLPAGGPVAGGTQVTVVGANFAFANSPTVTVDGVVVPGAASLDESSVSLTMPVGLRPGPVQVVVTNADGQSAAASYQYTSAGIIAEPTVTSLSHLVGSTRGGTYVTVFGSFFDRSSTVSFDGVPGRVVSWNPEFVGVFAPRHAAGPVDVTVTNQTGQVTVPGAFTYVRRGH